MEYLNTWFDANNDWTIEIRWIKAWIAYPIVIDKYSQTWKLKVTVEDTTLKLDTYEAILEPGQEIYIKATEYYGYIKKIRKK